MQNNNVLTIDILLKRNARTIYLSAKILPRNIRKAFYCGYLLCRTADTVADTTLIEPHKRIELIKSFPQTVKNQNPQDLETFNKAVENKISAYPSEKILLENFDICLKEYNSLTKKHKELVDAVVQSVCSGMECDLSYFPNESSGLLKAFAIAKQTEDYCNYMGGEPGVFWAKLLLDGKQDEEFVEDARKIGKALQITNILRDIPADVKIGRVYLPLSDLSSCNLMPQDLADKQNYRKLRPVIYKWINWGLENISAAPRFFAKIPAYKFANRAAVAWPVLWSLDTFYLLALSGNLLDAEKKQKIPKKEIYRTMLSSPFYCLSAKVFRRKVESKINEIKKILS